MPQKPTQVCAALTADAARAAFEAARRVAFGRDGDQPLAIVDANAGVVWATAAGLEVFEAHDRADLQRLLLAGEGPNARRLRHLAATLTIGGPPRLERVRFFVGRRPASVNLQCVRVAISGGATFLVLSTAAVDLGKELLASGGAHGASPPAPAVAPVHGGTSPKSRFLWSLDRDGRFGVADPSLIAALGGDAPLPGETPAAWSLRAAIENADELARAIEKRETFVDLPVVWRRTTEDSKLRVALSAAPVFDSRRDYAGYRGFGVIDERISVPHPHGGDGADERTTSARSAVDARSVSTPGPDVAWATEASAPIADPISDEPAPASPVEETAPPSPPFQEAAEDSRSMGAIGPSEGEARAGPRHETENEADGSESVPALPESADREAPPPVALQERTAEIYVLRQTHPTALPPAKVVPIRPGALDALAPHGPAPSADGDSVELSKSERDAFREIARALVGRAPASRQEGPTDGAHPKAGAHERLDESVAPPSVPESQQSSSGADFNETAQRNALGLLDRLPLGVVVARDARALYLNHTLLGLLGYRDFAHFESSDGLATMFRGGDPQAVSVKGRGALSIVKADGQTLAVEGQAQAIVWDGAPATLIALRPSLEAEPEPRLHDFERETPSWMGPVGDLQEMLDRSVDGAAILDAAGRILSFNQPAERLFGYDQREVMGESVLMLLAPQSHPETTAKLESLSQAGKAPAPAPDRPLTVVGRDRNGAALSLALTLARIGASDAPHFCALVRDLRRDREAERRLTAARDAALAASAAKTDFLAQVSHEIRTPLHAILGFAEVMMEERFGPIGNDRYRDYLKDIHTSGKHVMSLADDLLDLSKIESGKLELTFAPVDANSLIRECVSLMQPQAAHERVIVRVSLFDRLPRVMVDERSLKQIMLNLMSNAVKFNGPGGQVIVSTAVDAAGQAVIRVRDTGVGMNESEVGLALEPFGRIGKADRKGGVGLGLPLTKALVEANKAEFSIKSRRDHGTLVEIAFPIVQAAQ